MPKMKSNRAAAKRFKRTANGGFKSGAVPLMRRKT